MRRWTIPCPYHGWRFHYRTSDPAPGWPWPWRCARALRSDLPGAEVVVEPDPAVDLLTVAAPAGTPLASIARGRDRAAEAVERAHRAGLL